MKKLDETEWVKVADSDRIKTADKYLKDIEGYQKALKPYVKDLVGGIGKIDKDTWPQPYHDLKVIKTTLERIEADALSSYNSNSKSVQKASDKINEKNIATTNKMRKDGHDSHRSDPEGEGRPKPRELQHRDVYRRSPTLAEFKQRAQDRQDASGERMS